MDLCYFLRVYLALKNMRVWRPQRTLALRCTLRSLNCNSIFGYTIILWVSENCGNPTWVSHIVIDMSLNVGEIRGCIVETCPEGEFFRDRRRHFKETLVVDGGWLLQCLKMHADLSQVSRLLPTDFSDHHPAHARMYAYGKLLWAM